MALGFGSAKGDDVVALIAKKNYTKAIEILRAQLQKGKANASLRLQLGDVLVLAGKDREAVSILAPLADEFARDGFAAKAISVLKKIQKIDPSRRDVVEKKLASLIQEKQRVATITLPPASSGLPELGMEEIGFEPPAGGSINVPVSPPPAPVPAPTPVVLEPPRVVAPPPAAAPAPAATSAEVAFVEPEPLAFSVEPLALGMEPVVEPPAPPAPPPPAEPARAAAVIDRDLFTEEDLQLVDPDLEGGELEVEPLVEAEPVTEEAAPDPMSDARFAEELMGLVDNLFEPETEERANDRPLRPLPEGPQAGQQIVVSPLFKDFSVDEMVAVIAGLKLLTFERGDVIIRQGEDGHSLFMLTSGRVRAFVKNEAGKNVPVGDLTEGAFFGEMSMLTGKPRMATVAALTSSELLELDRSTLDDIATRHPHVLDVLQEFAAQRAR
jgi:hypothetical protein